MIDDEEYFAALSSYEKALSMKKKANFQYEMALGALKIAMGGGWLNNGREVNEEKNSCGNTDNANGRNEKEQNL